MSNASNVNALLATSLMISALVDAQKYAAILARAAAEGRDVTDAEIAGMRTAAVGATNDLAAQA